MNFRISLIKVVQIPPILTHKYAAGKCTDENGGTVTAGGDKSSSGLVGIHGIERRNGNSHFEGFSK